MLIKNTVSKAIASKTSLTPVIFSFNITLKIPYDNNCISIIIGTTIKIPKIYLVINKLFLDIGKE